MVGAGRHQQRVRSSAPSTVGEIVEKRALTPQSINLIVKRRCARAGLEAKEFPRTGSDRAI